ncbi:MAG: Cdc6/Cdc18 family protein [Nitrososphaerales archaeon]
MGVLSTLTTETLDSIFSRATHNQPLFKNHQALESDYVPSHLPFRAQQISSIGEVIAPILHRSKPSNLLIYGKTGTGKTAVTKYVTSRLKDSCINQKILSSFVYCNTRLTGTEYRTLAEVATTIGLKVPFTGLALSELLSRIQQHIKQNTLQVLLILDEIDYLVRALGDDLLYSLTTSADKTAPGSISLIGISNDLNFKEDLGARVISRLSEEELVFPPYSAEELRTILTERAGIALRSASYTNAAVNLCAALSGSEHGDARRAVDLLRVAAEVAEREASQQLEERHVKIALQKMDQDRVLDALKTLPLHAKIVLLATILSCQNERSKSSSGSVYEIYSNLCQQGATEPLTTRRVSGLLTELDTLGLVNATLVNYGRYGRTKKITSQVSLSTATKVFAEDETVKHLVPS